MVKGDALHVECSSYGTEADVPQIESVLTMESLPRDGAWVLQHQKNPVEVKCCHLTEAEWYGYYHGQAVDLGPVMSVAQFRVTDKVEAYLCMARALVFEGSILAYNPAKNKVEWVPVCGLTNDLTWAKERSNVALANYVLCIPEEAAHQLVSWPNNSFTSEEEEEEEQDPEPLTTDAELEWGEESEDRARQMDLDEEGEPNRQWHSQDWEAVMGEMERDQHMMTRGQTLTLR